MANLTEEQKHHLVSMLACFREPAVIISHFQLEHGLSLTHKQVGRYDPTRAYFAGGDKWRAIFQAQRDTYLGDVSRVPIAHQAYRLNLLQQGVEEASRSGNWNLVSKLLEHAAKEVGGALTNNRKLSVEESKPTFLHQSAEERRAAMVEIIKRAKLAIQDKGSVAVRRVA